MNGVWNNDRLIRVDMTNLAVTIEEFPAHWKYLGGRSLSARASCWTSVILPATRWVRITSWYWLRVSCRERLLLPRDACPSAAKARLRAA